MGAAGLILVIALSVGEVEALFDTLQPGVDPVESVRVVTAASFRLGNITIVKLSNSYDMLARFRWRMRSAVGRSRSLIARGRGNRVGPDTTVGRELAADLLQMANG